MIDSTKDKMLSQAYNFFLYGYRILVEPFLLLFFVIIFQNSDKEEA